MIDSYFSIDLELLVLTNYSYKEAFLLIYSWIYFSFLFLLISYSLILITLLWYSLKYLILVFLSLLLRSFSNSFIFTTKFLTSLNSFYLWRYLINCFWILLAALFLFLKLYSAIIFSLFYIISLRYIFYFPNKNEFFYFYIPGIIFFRIIKHCSAKDSLVNALSQGIKSL